MNSRNYGAPGSDEAEDVVPNQVEGDGVDSGNGDAEERLGDELAAFAFLREEDDREVRLSFRDVPADSIANSFRRAGALFISLAGERVRTMEARPASPASVTGASAEEDVPPLSRRKRRRKADAESRAAQGEIGQPPGELIVRYFYATENLVYTVIITSSTGIIKSIARVYPSAELSERELRVRLGAITG